MEGGDAGDHLAESASDDDLYSDFKVGFLPLLPLSPSVSPSSTSQPKTPSPGPSPSPAPTSPPKTPSPGLSPSPACPAPTSQPKSPSPGPWSSPPPAPVPHPVLPESEPEPRHDASPRHQPPRPPPPAPRHPAPRGGDAPTSSSQPGCTALYISELTWWTTDAEVEAVLAPHAAALRGLYFYFDRFTGKSRGVCRADFLHREAATDAAAALHGRDFHGRQCFASLSRPPALLRLGDDSNSNAEAAQGPNPARGRGRGGRGRGATNSMAVRGNVGSALMGDRPTTLAPPVLPMAPLQRGPPFGGVMGGVAGYHGFQPMGQYNAGMVTGMMPSAMAPHVNPAFYAAGGVAMHGPGVWHDQAMAGGLWGAMQPWNSRDYQMPWQQLMSPAQQHQAQEQSENGDHGKGRGKWRERPGSKSEENVMGIGTVRSYPERRQSDRDEGDQYKGHGREENGRHRECVLEKESEDRDRHGGDTRRYQDQEYTERDDVGRRGRVRSRSQTSDGSDDEHPRRRR